MTQKLTKKERDKLARIANKLYRNGLGDEHKAMTFYRRMVVELRKVGFYTEADALDLMAEGAETTKELLSEIIQDIREKVVVSSFKKETTLKGDFRPSKRRY